MKIWVLNKNKKLICDFVACALLRDNVQHHIEAVTQVEKFSCLHSLADVVWADEQALLSAAKLRDELRTAWTAIQGIPYGHLAISIHTRAAVQGLLQPPAVSGTVLHSATRWQLPKPSHLCETLGDLFHTLVFELFIIALQPLEDGVVAVGRDGGPMVDQTSCVHGPFAPVTGPRGRLDS